MRPAIDSDGRALPEAGGKRDSGGDAMKTTKEILDEYGIRPVKSLGQNFLADERVLARIADMAGISDSDCVIEIGPGIGNLTMKLAEKAGSVVAIEKDKKLIPVLQDLFKNYKNVIIINDDILEVDLGKVIRLHRGSASSVKVVANLPYYITTPIIMKLLEEDPRTDSITVMVQKEVADRLTASPSGKGYGALTVAAGYYSTVEKLMDVAPGSFIPSPKVYSSVVRLVPKKQTETDPERKRFFFMTVKAAFGQRRKKLVNALFNSGNFTMDKEEIRKTLVRLGIDPGCRGETLSIVQFAQLSDSFFQKNR